METAIQNTEPKKTNYLNADYGVKSWLLTTDHKRIALLYLGSITAVLLPWRLLRDADSSGAADSGGRPGALRHLQQAVYHARRGDDFPVSDSVDSGGVRQLPGADDDRRQGPCVPQAEPGELVPVHAWRSFIVYSILTGGLDTGWTFYTPYSTTYSNTNVVSAAIGVFIVGFSSIFTGLNIMVTVHRMRAPGLTWQRLPLFIWAHYATSVIMVLGTPVLAITIVLVALERIFHFGIFDARLGGDPLLFQHLFWFYSHPAVYIMILPSMAVISEVIACFSRKRPFGYNFIAMSSIAIAVLGFLVWAHHMFVAGISTYAAMIFSLLTFFVAIPSAVKVFNWTATLYKGSITFETPMLYAFAFIGLFTIGGLTGVFLGAVGIDLHVTDTYFVVAHFHYVMVGGGVTGFLCALHFWWPKMTGKMYPESFAKLSAVLVFLGFNLTFFPQFLLGYMGMPRRYHAYPPEFQVLNVLSTAGASILAVGFLLPMIYFAWSLRYGKDAGPNPYRAAGLEWQTASPPTTFNFEETPVVTWEAYNYDEIDGTTEGVEVAG